VDNEFFFVELDPSKRRAGHSFQGYVMFKVGKIPHAGIPFYTQSLGTGAGPAPTPTTPHPTTGGTGGTPHPTTTGGGTGGGAPGMPLPGEQPPGVVSTVPLGKLLAGAVITGVIVIGGAMIFGSKKKVVLPAGVRANPYGLDPGTYEEIRSRVDPGAEGSTPTDLNQPTVMLSPDGSGGWHAQTFVEGHSVDSTSFRGSSGGLSESEAEYRTKDWLASKGYRPSDFQLMVKG
jgi:hypothetical protein